MSVGTIVTIVLLMTVLILGLVLTRTIFTSSVENINSIDQSVKNEINKLFSEDDSRELIIYPPTRNIQVENGEQGGFGFSIRNIESSDRIFNYDVTHSSNSCGITPSAAQNLMVLGQSGSGINIRSGNSLDNPILVRFDIGQAVPVCSIRYNLQVSDQSGSNLETVSIDLKITPN